MCTEAPASQQARTSLEEDQDAVRRIEALGLSSSPIQDAEIPNWPLPTLFPEEIATMILPGAGLAQAGSGDEFLDDSDAIFDGIFNLPTPPIEPMPQLIEDDEDVDVDLPHVRGYSSDQDLFVRLNPDSAMLTWPHSD